ncbi:MAG: FUSC family protein [Streptosporangiaceae bacterium]
MTSPTAAARPASAREPRAPRPWRSLPALQYAQVSWSQAAALRAVRAVIIIPLLFALTHEVIGSAQMTLFAVFGGVGTLIMTSFAGTRRDKALAHLGLAVAGSAALVIGTLADGSAWLAALVTLPVAFAITFAGLAGPNAAAGVTGTLLAFVLPVASAGGTATIAPRLAGWWLASAVSTAAVLALSPPAPGDRLRARAAGTAAGLAGQLEDMLRGACTADARDASVTARHELMAAFAATPYRPTGLADADRGLAGVIHLLEWCSSLTCDLAGEHLDLRAAAPPDRDLLARSAAALRDVAALLSGQPARPGLEQLWQARAASAARLRALDGTPAAVRRGADEAFHAQIIGVAATAAAADALVAARRASPDEIAEQRRRWMAARSDGSPGQPASPAAAAASDGQARPPGPPGRRLLARASGTLAVDASIRSVWFRNAARGAAALAAAVAVAKLTDVQHAFWVVLGTLSVLRTSAASTGATALRALAGTAAGFAVGAALLLGIGTSAPALWVAFPLAILVAAYAPGTAPFVVGQAAFTVTIVVLFNLLDPAGWRVGLLRVEDVAIGCAVSVIVGALLWPRGASSLVGDNLADAFRSGASYLADAANWALGAREQRPGRADAAITAGIRLDDALRGYLTEQGSKRLARDDLWVLVMAAMRLRLTAHSLASMPATPASAAADGAGHGPGHPLAAWAAGTLGRQAAHLAYFYDELAAQVGRPGRGQPPPEPIPVPAGAAGQRDQLCSAGPAHYHSEALWVGDHLRQLAAHAAAVPGPAARLAQIRRRPWWR